MLLLHHRNQPRTPSHDVPRHPRPRHPYHKAATFIAAEAGVPVLITRPIYLNEKDVIVYVVYHINDGVKRVRGTKLVLEAHTFNDNVFHEHEVIRTGYTKGSLVKRAAQLIATV